MALKLPRLTTEIDCAPIGYPGLMVTFWLNPPQETDAAVVKGPQPWESAWYHGLGRVFVQMFVPGEYTDDGEDEVIPLDGARSLYDLERRGDFDPAILVWSAGQLGRIRAERMQTEIKN